MNICLQHTVTLSVLAMSDVLPEAQCSLCVVAEFVRSDMCVEGV